MKNKNLYNSIFDFINDLSQSFEGQSTINQKNIFISGKMNQSSMNRGNINQPSMNQGNVNQPNINHNSVIPASVKQGYGSQENGGQENGNQSNASQSNASQYNTSQSYDMQSNSSIAGMYQGNPEGKQKDVVMRLQQAVVMSEILSKPVSKTRRYRRSR